MDRGKGDYSNKILKNSEAVDDSTKNSFFF